MDEFVEGMSFEEMEKLQVDVEIGRGTLETTAKEVLFQRYYFPALCVLRELVISKLKGRAFRLIVQIGFSKRWDSEMEFEVHTFKVRCVRKCCRVLQTFAMVILIMDPVVADDVRYARPDFLLPSNLIVTDKGGKRIGYLRKDPLIRDQYHIEGRDGKTKGWIRADPLFRNRWRIDQQGAWKGIENDR